MTDRTGHMGNGHVEVSIPILPVLGLPSKPDHVAISPSLLAPTAQPFANESFANEFRRACRDRRRSGLCAGLRKVAAGDHALRHPNEPSLLFVRLAVNPPSWRRLQSRIIRCSDNLFPVFFREFPTDE